MSENIVPECGGAANRTRLEWAQWFARQGIATFVVEANSKRPVGGHSWMTRHTTDPKQIADWFEETPNCNYGLWLRDEYVVIDLDVLKGTDGISGIDAFEAICAEKGMPDFRRGKTLKVRTPSGGWHLYFKAPFKCANKNTFPNLIDVRGAVGYVVGCGSKIAAGTWTALNPNTPIAPLPAWLAGYLKPVGYKNLNHHVPVVELDLPENVAQAEAWIVDQPPAIEGEEGDFHTYKTVCAMRDFGITEGEALRILCEGGWNSKCEPPWDAAHLEVKINNSYEYAENRPGVKAETYQVDKLMACRPTAEQVQAVVDSSRSMARTVRRNHRKKRRRVEVLEWDS